MNAQASYPSPAVGPTPVMGRIASVYEAFLQNLDMLSEKVQPVRAQFDGPEKAMAVPEEVGETELERLVLELERCNRRFRTIIQEIHL